MFKRIAFLILICLVLFFVCNDIQAREQYDTDFLKRQIQFHNIKKAEGYIKNRDYLNVAFIALSIYPVDSTNALYLALSLEDKVDKPLKDFLFEAFQEGVAADPSLRYKKGGKTVVNGAWMKQKAKWADDLIAEVIIYQQVKKHLKNDKKATNKLFFSALHSYFILDKEGAMKFAESFNKNSMEYKILNNYMKAAFEKPVNIKELEKIDINKLSKAMKEMIAILKGNYYLEKDIGKAKEACLEFFELGYSLPIHIENLATCYIATDSYEDAKPLLLYLTRLYQVGNISPGGIYNLACIFGREGNADEALRYLKAAIKRGFSKNYAKNDDDLKILRNDQRFIDMF